MNESKALVKKIKLPLLLLGILIFPLYLGSYIPVEAKSFFYAISLSIKAVLEFFLPFIIFSFVFSCLSNLQKGAFFLICLLIACVFLSNLVALMLGYSSGLLGLHLLDLTNASAPEIATLSPAWKIHLTKLISNDIALMCGFVAGMLLSIKPNEHVKKVANTLNFLANSFLKRLFIPVLPFFILGFIFKLEYEQILQTSLKIYGPLLLLIIATQWLYLIAWYMAAAGFSWKGGLAYFKNVLPASFTGLTTISSAASMPVLLVSTEKNLQDAKTAQMLVPAVINIHTIGSAIGVPILALATLATFNLPTPSLSTFFIFALYVSLAKFAVAAVPGGVIIVVAPLLEAHLGFSSSMVGLITAIYMVCDPFGTAANVTGNGVFPIVFSKLYQRLSHLFSRNKSEKTAIPEAATPPHPLPTLD